MARHETLGRASNLVEFLAAN